MNSSNNSTMATYNELFTHHEIQHNIINYYGKEEATDENWERINTYLEEKWGGNGTNKHYKWAGFRINGKFETVFVKKPCSPHICECEECEECGAMTCNRCDDDDDEDSERVICTLCELNKENEDEDEEDEGDEEEEQLCGVCGKSCKTDETDDLVLVAEINGVKHCDACLKEKVCKK